MTKPLARGDIARASPRQTIGIDFGTTNTVLAISGVDGDVSFVRFDHRGDSITDNTGFYGHLIQGFPPRSVGKQELGRRPDSLCFVSCFQSEPNGGASLCKKIAR